VILRCFMGFSYDEIDRMTDWEVETYPGRWVNTIVDILSVMKERLFGDFDVVESPESERGDKEKDVTGGEKKREDFEAGFVNVMDILKKAGN
jgi:hypothetical protein